MGIRAIVLVLVLAIPVAVAGCGGSVTRAEWSTSITPICDKIKAVGEQVAPRPGMQPAELKAALDAGLQQLPPLIAELKAAERPKDDAGVEQWLALQEEGQAVYAGMSAALASGDQLQYEAALTRIEEYTRRDKQAAEAVGAPASCHS